MSEKPLRLNETPVHLGAGADPLMSLTGFGFDQGSFQSYIEQCCADDPGHLVMVETTPVNWKSWERHPAGDELVIILEGKGQFIQETDTGQISIDVKAGDAVINPRGIWHTANVEEPIKAVYITPCPGTEHRQR